MPRFANSFVLSPDIANWLAWLGYGPTVTARTADQSWTEGQTISLRLPTNTFTDTLGLAMSYRATLGGGAALPGWLSFDASTESFTGIVPTGTASFAINLFATDIWGLTRGEQFNITVATLVATVGGHSAPVLATQTANQIWAAGVAQTLTLAGGTFGSCT